jgi:hypothetical protein
VADWNEHHDLVLATSVQALQTLAAVFTASFLALLILPVSRWILYPFTILPPIVTALTLLNKVRNTAINDADARVWYAERIRGLRAGRDADHDGEVETEERMRESAEWANGLLAGVWPIMNPSLFDSLVDMLEDIMQGSMPTFVVCFRVVSFAVQKISNSLSCSIAFVYLIWVLEKPRYGSRLFARYPTHQTSRNLINLTRMTGKLLLAIISILRFPLCIVQLRAVPRHQVKPRTSSMCDFLYYFCVIN